MSQAGRLQSSREPSVAVGYLIAATSAFSVLGIKIALLSVMPDAYFRVPDILLIGAVAYFCGLGPGVLAMALSVFGYFYIYMPPTFSMSIARAAVADWVQFGSLFFGNIIALIAMRNLRESRRRLAERTEQLEEEAHERKHAEEDMRRSRQLLSEAEKLSHTGAWEWDVAGNRWTFSDEWLAIHGLEKRTLMPEELLEISHPDDREAVRRAFEEVSSGARPYDIEHRIIRQDNGEVRLVRAHGQYVRNPAGAVVRVYGFAQDITERKHAEEALRESEAQLRAVLENMTEGVIISQLDGNLIFWNRAALQIHGYASLDECRRRLPEFTDTFELRELNGGLVPIDEWPFARILRGEQLRDWQLRVRHLSQGWQRVFSYGGSTVRDAEGEPMLALLTVADITKRKQTEEEIKKLNAELEQRVERRTAELQAANVELEASVRELEAFSYSVSHDLRTPLRAMGGFSEALLKYHSDSLDAKGKDYLSRIGAAAQRMSQLIDDILGLSRASRAEMHRENIDMSAIAREILDERRRSQPHRKAEISVEPDMIVNADAHLLRIALDNLLGNAWKFTSNREVTRIEVASIEQNGKRVYVIRDNGAGFNPAYADKLFKPFQRLHAESDFPGTGIGLALVQRILRRHGGRIWAESEIDNGAAFYFTLRELDQ